MLIAVILRVTVVFAPTVIVVFRTVSTTWTKPHRSAAAWGPVTFLTTIFFFGRTAVAAVERELATAFAADAARNTAVTAAVIVGRVGFIESPSSQGKALGVHVPRRGRGSG